jgi:hypothetical protein
MCFTFHLHATFCTIVAMYPLSISTVGIYFINIVFPMFWVPLDYIVALSFGRAFPRNMGNMFLGDICR